MGPGPRTDRGEKILGLFPHEVFLTSFLRFVQVVVHLGVAGSRIFVVTHRNPVVLPPDETITYFELIE